MCARLSPVPEIVRRSPMSAGGEADRVLQVGSGALRSTNTMEDDFYVQRTLVGELTRGTGGNMAWSTPNWAATKLGLPKASSLRTTIEVGEQPHGVDVSSMPIPSCMWQVQARLIDAGIPHAMFSSVPGAPCAAELPELASKLREAFARRAACPEALDLGWAWYCPFVGCRSLVSAVAEINGRRRSVFVTCQVAHAQAHCREITADSGFDRFEPSVV